MNLFELFARKGHELFEVGGAVRDKACGITPQDIDFATSALPQETMAILASAGLKAIPIGIEFGTVQTLVGDEKIEITTFRCKESFTKGSRKPAVVFGETIETDLGRRDFTFNAMALDKSGNFLDPFGGMQDLHNKLVRTPGDPDVAFSDDPLRMLRACRFVGRGFQLDKSVKDSMRKNAEKLLKLSAERIFEEMTKILCSPVPSSAINAMAETSLLGVVFPELETLRTFRKDQGKWHHLPVWEHTLLVVDSSFNKSPVRWAAMFHDIAKPQTRTENNGNVHFFGHDEMGATMWQDIARRLKCSNEFREHVSLLIFEHQNVRESNPSSKSVRNLINRLGSLEKVDDFIHLRRADIMGHHPMMIEQSLQGLSNLVDKIAENSFAKKDVKLPKGLGNKLAESLGIKPGPELGKVMGLLQQKLVDGEISLDADFVAIAKGIFTAS